MDPLESSRYLRWVDLHGGLLSACTVALIGENEVEFDIQVFLNLSGVLYIKTVMELPGWQLGARHQRTSLDSVFSCVTGGPFCCHKRKRSQLSKANR